MKNSPLLKYKIGLGVIGALSFILFIVVLVQASGVKHDKETYKKADKVARSLENYVDRSGKIPATLPAAGIRDVPNEVSYQKLSGSKYTFCVTYNADSNGFDATYLESQLVTGGHAEDYYGTSDGDQSYLYLSDYHHKGKNCQTVKPYLYSTDYDYKYYDSSSTDYNTQSF